MSVGAERAPLSPRRPRRVLAALQREPSDGARVYVLLGVVSVVLAAFSLRFPSTPNYDPWAWLIWGREIVHLHLSTSGGPTWKPLTMIFTTAFAPFGSLSPDLWLILSRAGGLMALALMFTLTFRLAQAVGVSDAAPRPLLDAGRSRLIGGAPPLLAGVLATVGLLVLSQYAYDVSLGYSEGLVISLALLGILRHLDGARFQAFALGFGASLDRPEIWPFLLLYALFLWRAEPASRRRVVVLLALILPLWLLPDLWGSGSLTRGVNYAIEPQGPGPATARCPFCAELTAREWPLVITPFKVSLLFLIGLCAAQFARGNRLRRSWMTASAIERVLVILALGLALGVEDAVLTEAGSSGNNRYLFLAACLVIVAGSVGWAGAMTWLGALLSRIARARVAVLAAVLLTLAAFGATASIDGSWLISTGPTLSALRYQAQTRQDMPKAVQAAGGRRRLIACGPIQTNPATAPLLAWTLGVRISRTQSLHGNVLVRARSGVGAPVEPEIPGDGRFQLVADVRTVQIFTACG